MTTLVYRLDRRLLVRELLKHADRRYNFSLRYRDMYSLSLFALPSKVILLAVRDRKGIKRYANDPMDDISKFLDTHFEKLFGSVYSFCSQENFDS